MIFSIDLSDAHARGGSDIRDAWARQRIYNDIARYARTPDPAILQAIRETAERYRIAIPHEDRL